MALIDPRFDQPRFKKPGNQWSLADLDAWDEIEQAIRVESGQAAREDAEAKVQAERWQAERQETYRNWKDELTLLEADPEGDENTSYRIQCLRADIFSYEQAQAAWERGDEDMEENPYEQGL
jgi:hypothetical protein